MGIFSHFPYTNFHDINLDWILNVVKTLWKGVDDLDNKIDDFIIETEPTIRDQVDQWLDEHPEATTTVEDGSLTLPKFSDALKDDVILNNQTGIHKVNPTYYANKTFIPEGRYANGLCADENYFYIAHRLLDDTSPLMITRVSKTDPDDVADYTLDIVSHGSTLTYYNGLIYIMDGDHNRIDVVRAANPSVVVYTFTPNLQSIAFGLYKDADDVISALYVSSSNSRFTLTQVVNDKQVLRSITEFNDTNRNYIQGLDFTNNYIYVARATPTIVDLNQYPVIQAFSFNGRLINEMTVMLKDFSDTQNSDGRQDKELEDIYRDTTNNLIWFVTSSGRLGSVNTYGFLSSYAAHDMNQVTMREANSVPYISLPNDTPLVNKVDNTNIATNIPTSPYASSGQGTMFGSGIIAGDPAIFQLRVNSLYGYGFSRANYKLNSFVYYAFNSTTKTFDFVDGYVVEINSGVITKRSLVDYSTEHTDHQTMVNYLATWQNTDAYNRKYPDIPLS